MENEIDGVIIECDLNPTQAMILMKGCILEMEYDNESGYTNTIMSTIDCTSRKVIDIKKAIMEYVK